MGWGRAQHCRLGKQEGSLDEEEAAAYPEPPAPSPQAAALRLRRAVLIGPKSPRFGRGFWAGRGAGLGPSHPSLSWPTCSLGDQGDP